MKKILSMFMLLLVISSNCFLYCFANEEEVIQETWSIIENVEDFEQMAVLEETKWSEESNKQTKSENNYSCNECAICYDINQEPDADFCDFCLECDDDTWITNWWDLEDEDLPNLIISEVFFGWSNEWIEIYNAWDDFEWKITISWASNSSKNFNIAVSSESIIILRDSNVNMILDENAVVYNDAKFTISDSNPMNISLIISWETIDDFSKDPAWINNNTSFHRIIETNEIVATTSEYSVNVTDQYLANPWYVFLQELESEDWEEPELTWNIVEVPKLKITEIYFDSGGSWFEITNIWENDFSWDLTLNWSLNINIPVEITAWISKVFANDLAMFQTWNDIEILENQIVFASGEIDLNLIWSGETLDNFFVHESRVNYSYWWMSSFEKVWAWNNRITTYVWLSDRRYNINRWIVANPTKYFATWENLIDATAEKTDYSMLEIPVDCDSKQSGIEISEVYFWNSTYPTYIEILQKNDILEDYIYLFVTWSALHESIFFEINQDDLDSKFILLSDSNVWSDKWWNSTYDTAMKLNDSWRIAIYGIYSDDRDNDWDYFTFSEELLDVIFVEKSSAWNSVYQSSKNVQCAYIFNKIRKFSPWLTEWQSDFIQITPEPIIEYIHVWWWGWSCPNNEQPVFDNTSSLTSEIQISAIKYYWNYQILKLKNKINSDINLRDYYLQFLDWTTKNIQWNTLFAKSTMSVVWNYWLPKNQDFCVNLMKDWEVVDRYCRNSLTKATAQDEENIRNQLTFREDLYSEEWETEEWTVEDEFEISNNTWNLLQTNTIKIIDIDYDPAWADWDNESVTLLLLTWTQVDLSDYKFYYTKDGKTQKAKAQIQWILSYWNRQTFKWWFAFPNSTDDKKSVTVNLIWPDGKVVDTYIYNPNKITEIQAGDYEIISVIDGDTAKINYDWQEIAIRFAGIDAPESSALRCWKIECFWPEAKQYLKTLIEWKTVYFEPASMDWYDRFVWYIFLNWENINEKMIKNWYAREYSYKNQTYKYQSKFKSAQNYAQNNSLWLRWYECKWERLCPVEETQAEYDFVFNIENIIYDPEWSDNWNEEIRINMIEWISVEFGTDFYLLVNDTKKSLKKYGSISPWETKKLTWNFWFPNNKLTTVSLVYNWKILDTYVYNPELDKLVDTGSTLSTWDELLAQISQFQILSILPNPYWADWLNEEIELYCKSELPNLNLSSGFYLQIWTTKKYLKWEISTNESVNLKWAFSFPNKWGCVELGYNWFIFDKFCYTQPDEWQKFYVSNWAIESISTLDLSILKNSKLENVWNKVCLTYAGQKFACKNMPYSKLSTKRINQNKMYKNFFDSFENYMKNNWKIMYYDSEIKNYFDLLNDIENVISDWKTQIEVEENIFDISEFQTIYDAKYKKTPGQTFSNVLKSIIWDEIINKYESLKSEYIAILMDK